MGETTAQRRARQKAEVDTAIKPYFEMWLDDLRRDGIALIYPMPSVNEPLRVTSAFGNRQVWRAKGGKASTSHQAIDYVPVRSPAGRDVKVNAGMAGRVMYAGTPDDESGVSVIVGGVDGVIYSYAHGEAGSLKVKAGDVVGRNQQLMLMGDTGVTTAKCLHIVERPLPFKADGLPDSKYKDWRWQKSKSTDHQLVQPGIVRAALDAWENTLGHAINFRDFKKTEPSVLWQKDPDKGDQFRGAIVADLTPAYFESMRMQRNELPKGTPMYMALDAVVRMGGLSLSDGDVKLSVDAKVKTRPKAPAKPAAKKEEGWTFAGLAHDAMEEVGEWFSPSPAKAAPPKKPVAKPAAKPAAKKAKDDDWSLSGWASSAADLASDMMGIFSPAPAKAKPAEKPIKHR